MDKIISAGMGRLSWWIFPIFTIIFAMIIAFLWWIHHPDIANGYAVLKEFDPAEQVMLLELDNPRNDLAAVSTGQHVRIRSSRYNGSFIEMLRGRLTHVAQAEAPDKLMVEVQLSGGQELNATARAVYRPGSKVDLLVVVNDMRLLQHIFNVSSHTISPGQ